MFMSPLQGLTIFILVSQGVALGYYGVPRWGLKKDKNARLAPRLGLPWGAPSPRLASFGAVESGRNARQHADERELLLNPGANARNQRLVELDHPEALASLEA